MTTAPWVWELMRATGVISWFLLSATVIWGLLMRTRLVTIGSPLRMHSLHRYLGALALAVLTVHLVTVLADSMLGFNIVNLIVPFTAPWEPFAVGLGVIALWLIVPVTVIGRVRARMGKAGARWFQKTHLAAYAAWPFATGHYLLSGTDAHTAWSAVLLVTSTTLIAFLLIARGWYGRRPIRRAPVTTRAADPVPETVQAR